MSDLKNAYRWVPSVYLMQGLPYALVTEAALIFYKNFNYSNAKIAFYTSLFSIPWFLKALIAPSLESIGSKRNLTLSMEYALAGLFLILAICLQINNFFLISIIIFFAIAFTSAMHDTSSDGLYIVSLDKTLQAHFVGIRTLAYQLGRLISKGGLIIIVGYLITKINIKTAWQMALAALAGFSFIIASYHYKYLPINKNDIINKSLLVKNPIISFKNVWLSFFQMPHLISIIIFVLTYNFAEAQLIKIVPLFLIDQINNGGLGLSIKYVGFIYGIIGSLAILLGISIAGFILTRITLKKLLVPVTVFATITNIGYMLLSYFNIHSQVWLIFVIVITEFAFGIANGCYMFYLLTIFTRSSYPMSMYAIGTAIMSLGMILGGMISGYMQHVLGYVGFYSWILIVNIFVIIISIYNSQKVLL